MHGAVEGNAAGGATGFAGNHTIQGARRELTFLKNVRSERRGLTTLVGQRMTWFNPPKTPSLFHDP
jgi:hypothetical protein